MQRIYHDRKIRNIKNKERIEVSSFSSYHLIILTARTKSEKQLWTQATDDEDLRVTIDGKTFPQIQHGRLVDAPAAFSGGKLHNRAKTVYFIIFLKGKDHTISLQADTPPGTATFESLNVYTIDGSDMLTLEPKLQAEDGDRRPWVTFVLDTIPLQSFTTTFTYAHRKRDSDDVKIRVDGKTRRNLIPNIKHFLWRFVGSLLPWSSPTQTETETFVVHLSQGLHSIEFDADRMPILEKIVFRFGKALPIPEGVPTVDNPKWTGNFSDDTEEMLLARAVYGEVGGESSETKTAVGWAIRNRVDDTTQRWGNNYHEVILTSFQYEPFNDPKKAVFEKITHPPTDDTIEGTAWQKSFQATQSVLSGNVPDPTKGANHFLAKTAHPWPSWATEEAFTLDVGGTKFYRL